MLSICKNGNGEIIKAVDFVRLEVKTEHICID